MAVDDQRLFDTLLIVTAVAIALALVCMATSGHSHGARERVCFHDDRLNMSRCVTPNETWEPQHEDDHDDVRGTKV